jgi:hypothetical protein
VTILSFDAIQDGDILDDFHTLFQERLQTLHLQGATTPRIAAMPLSSAPPQVFVNVNQHLQVLGYLEWLYTKQPHNITILNCLSAMKNNVPEFIRPVSRMQKEISHRLSAELSRLSNKYRVENEFHGLKGGDMPVDCAIYFEDKLIALIEIDGPQHYTSEGKLTRHSQFKSFLYAKNYPNVPLRRYRGIEDTEIGKSDAVLRIVSDITTSA